MNGASHRLAGAVTGAAWTVHAGPSHWSTPLIGAAVASAAAHGWMSPDVDQTEPFRWLQRVTPNRPWGDPWRHRGLTHWWGLPVAAWLAVAAFPAREQWVAQLLILGWASHLAADFVTGGVPILGWAGTFGARFKTGGVVEAVLARAVFPVLLVWLVTGAHRPPFPGGVS